MFQSKYKEEGKKEASMSLYSILPETPETQHAREASELQSEVVTLRCTKISLSTSTDDVQSRRSGTLLLRKTSSTL